MKNPEKLIILPLLSVLLLNCSDDSIRTVADPTKPGPGDDVVIVDDLDGGFEIRYGQTVQVLSEDLDIYFSDVLLDARCPEDVKCFWEGQAEAEFWFYKQGRDPSVAVPVIRGGKDPQRYPHLSAQALGYGISLVALYPYPEHKLPVKKSRYAAVVAVEELPTDTGHDDVIFTWASPSSLQQDEVTVKGAAIQGDILVLNVLYSGGCRDHDFRVFMQPAFMESYPVQANLYLQHIGHDDPCEAIISGEASFNIRPIAELHLEHYGAYADVVLNIFGYFDEVPTQKISVIYTPE